MPQGWQWDLLSQLFELPPCKFPFVFIIIFQFQLFVWLYAIVSEILKFLHSIYQAEANWYILYMYMLHLDKSLNTLLIHIASFYKKLSFINEMYS